MNIIKKCKYGTMIINRRDSWVGDSLDIYGEFSESEVEVFRKYIKPGDVVLDVGANIGAHTIVLSQLVGENGQVFAFEPERMNYYTLCGNVAINNCTNVVALQYAISNVNEPIKVPIIDAAGTANFGALELDKDYSMEPHYIVPCIKLDDINLDKCNFIKMDVEGMEQLALEGGSNLIKQCKPVLYIEDDRPKKSNELRKYITSLEYAIEESNAPLFNPTNFNKEKYNIFSGIMSINLVCFSRYQA